MTANTVVIVPDLLTLATPGYAATAVVSVTLSLPHAPRGQTFLIMVDGGDDGGRLEVGRVALFGHGMPHGPMSFALPFGETLGELGRRGGLKVKRILRFTAVKPPTDAGARMGAMEEIDIPVQSVVIDGG